MPQDETPAEAEPSAAKRAPNKLTRWQWLSVLGTITFVVMFIAWATVMPQYRIAQAYADGQRDAKAASQSTAPPLSAQDTERLCNPRPYKTAAPEDKWPLLPPERITCTIGDVKPNVEFYVSYSVVSVDEQRHLWLYKFGEVHATQRPGDYQVTLLQGDGYRGYRFKLSSGDQNRTWSLTSDPDREYNVQVLEVS